MINRIEVISRIPDTRAKLKKNQLYHTNKNIKEVFLVDVYTIDSEFNNGELAKIASMLVNPVFQKAANL